MKISDYAKVIPRNLWEPDEKKSWMTLFRCVGLVVLFQYLLFILPQKWIYAPLYGILIFISGLSFVGLFVLVHDCGHYSFSRKKILNDIVGFLAFIPMLNSFHGWRKAHDFHHRNNQIRKVDPDWPELLFHEKEIVPWHEKLAVRLGPGNVIGLLIGFWVGMAKRFFFSILIPQMEMTRKEKITLYLQNILAAIFSAFFLINYYEFLGPDKFWIMYFGPVLIATTTGAFLTFLQHSHPGSYVFDRDSFDVVLSQVHSTVNVRFPKLLEYFWLDINIHLPHHVIPGIPWYNLKDANNALQTAFEKDVREVDFSWKLLKDCWRSTKLQEIRPGVFQLVRRTI